MPVAGLSAAAARSALRVATGSSGRRMPLALALLSSGYSRALIWPLCSSTRCTWERSHRA